MHADTLNVLKLTLVGKVSAFGYPSATVLLASTLAGNSVVTYSSITWSEQLATYKRPGNEASCNSNQGPLGGGVRPEASF